MTPPINKNSPLFYSRAVYGVLLLITVLVFSFRAISRHPGKQAVPIAEPATDCSQKTGLHKVICLCEAFKATLTEKQLALVQLDYSKQTAVRWSNFPQQFSNPNRLGINLGSLNATQLSAAKALMAAVLSHDSLNEGYGEMEGVMAADDYFGKTTGQTGTFGSGNYYIAFLGTPSATQQWELQFGGHHFAFANTYNGGLITGVTPSFRGVEPAATISANGRSYQPIEQERLAFATVVSSLTDAEKTAAKLSTTFDNILLGPGGDGKFPNTKQGIKAASLSPTQQKQIIQAIGLYVNDLDAATAKNIMAKYIAELPETYICYAGSGTMNVVNDYVRIDGPGIWLEYSCQPSHDFPGTTHPHSVWRDRRGDYGGN